MSKIQTPLEMTQGSTFSTIVQMPGQDLSTYVFNMQMRRFYSSNTISESLSSANGEIVVTDSLDTIILTLPATRTAALFVDYTVMTKPPKTLYVYDIEYTDPTGYSDKLLSGTITVYGEVTR